MVKKFVPTLEILVAGDPGKAKENFINSILSHQPPSAEIHRKNVTIHFIYKPGNGMRIQLHDVSKEENIDLDSCEKMAVIIFCYSAHDPESLQGLEKWFRLLRSKIEKKETHSFLVVDVSNVDFQRDVSQRLAEKANKLKETYGIKRFIQCPFEDEKCSSIIVQSILGEISLPKSNAKSYKLYREVAENSKTYEPKKYFNSLPTEYFNKKDEHLENINFSSILYFQEQLFRNVSL